MMHIYKAIEFTKCHDYVFCIQGGLSFTQIIWTAERPEKMVEKYQKLQ